MGKKDKKAKSAKAEDFSSSSEEKIEAKTRGEVNVSDDDAEANEDLSLKIVQKSMLRACKNDPRKDGVSEIVTDLKDKKKKKDKKEKKKSNKIKGIEAEEVAVPSEIDTGFMDFCGELFLVDNTKDTGKLDISDKAIEVSKISDKAIEVSEISAIAIEISEISNKAIEISDKAIETNPVEVSDNTVLRKLLRGPRYFDPPDNSWGACYNCGEEGHSTANCTSAKRKKPCFVCGSFEHIAKLCTKGRDCFICKQRGHRAKDCPEKDKSSKICLKCGDLGHDMLSCRNDYSPDDLKDIQCYICQVFGHLCCVNYSDPGPREVSCYRCGLSGHTGLACTGYRGDTNVPGSANSCYKCGVEGHFARECTSSIKTTKRSRDLSTPRPKSSKKNRDHKEIKSAPRHLEKPFKKKIIQYEEFNSAPPKKHRGGWITDDPGDFMTNKGKSKRIQYEEFNSAPPKKHRGGWITDDPGDFMTNKGKSNYWKTPSNGGDKIYSPNGDYSSSSKRPRKINFSDSPSNGLNQYYPVRYSASRYENNSNDWSGRHYNRW